MITKFISKTRKRGVQHAAIRNNEMRPYTSPHLVVWFMRHGYGHLTEPAAERRTIKTEAEEKGRNRSGSQRGAKTNAEGGETRNKGQIETKTKNAERRRQNAK